MASHLRLEYLRIIVNFLSSSLRGKASSTHAPTNFNVCFCFASSLDAKFNAIPLYCIWFLIEPHWFQYRNQICYNKIISYAYSISHIDNGWFFLWFLLACHICVNLWLTLCIIIVWCVWCVSEQCDNKHFWSHRCGRVYYWYDNTCSSVRNQGVETICGTHSIWTFMNGQMQPHRTTPHHSIAGDPGKSSFCEICSECHG